MSFTILWVRKTSRVTRLHLVIGLLLYLDVPSNASLAREGLKRDFGLLTLFISHEDRLLPRMGMIHVRAIHGA